MKVTTNFPTYVTIEGEPKLIEAGETVEVDGRVYTKDHPDIKHGTLTVRGKHEEADEDGDDEYRQEMMDAIEAATGTRPGARTKTETLEKKVAELEADQDEDQQGDDQTNTDLGTQE